MTLRLAAKDMINLNHLRIFFHAAGTGSFTAAAEKLCITQPAVTAQIHAFEEACDLKLFKKKGRNVHLTEEGRIIYDYARKVFEHEQEVEYAIDQLHDLKCGVLRIGTTKTYARYFMPFLIQTFLKRYPDIRVFLNEGSSLEMTSGLADFRNEIVVIAKADDNPAVILQPFSKEELLPILPPYHHLAGRKDVHFSELAREPIIMKDIGSGTRRRVNELFDHYKLNPRILMESNNVEFIKDLVQRGEGFSFLVRAGVANEIRAGKLSTLELKGKPLLLDVSIAYLKDQPLSRPAKAFLRLLEELAAKAKKEKGMVSLMARIVAEIMSERPV